MKKPEGFNIQFLYENFEQERLNVKKWQPILPIEVLKAVAEARKTLTWNSIVQALEKSGINTTYAQLKHQMMKAKQEKLLDNE